jgi:2-dehydropantoate 2-reductase
MLQDVEAGRRTEIDTLNGAIVRHADAQGIDVPVNRAVTSLVRGWERAHGLRPRELASCAG